MRPYYSEGSKTLGFEVVEQLGWRCPDWAVVPAASGSLYTKIWKGMNELAEIGLTDVPHTKMAVAQARGCSPIITAHEEGRMDIKAVRPNTLAKSLAHWKPRRRLLRPEDHKGRPTAQASPPPTPRSWRGWRCWAAPRVYSPRPQAV